MSEMPNLEQLATMTERYFGQSLGRLLVGSSILMVILGLVGAGGYAFFGTFIGGLVWPFVLQVFGATRDSITVDNLEAVAIVLTAVIVFFVVIFALFVLVAMRLVRRRVVPQSIIDELAQRRSDGIAILNMRPNAVDNLTETEKEKYVTATWTPAWDAWRSAVVSFLSQNLTLAEKLSFERLGLIAEHRFGFALTPEHAHKLMMLAKQLTILEDMIQRFQERR